MAPHPLVAVVGPTAVGKTAVAVRIAVDHGGEVVSLDSRQMYRGLDVGTAKPTAEELRLVGHHLVDVADPRRPLALSDVLDMARAAIADIRERGRLAVLAGGTGQYVWSLLEGWQVPPISPDADLRRRLEAYAEEHGAAALHERLRAADPDSAAAIDPRNVRRVVRALEVTESTGRPFSAWRRRGRLVDAVIVGLTRPRPELYARVDARIDEMLSAGLENEVRALVASGVGFHLPAMSGVGYREWAPFLAGAVDRAEVVRLIRRDTRRLVRAQGAWFRADDPRILWFDAGLTTPAEVSAAVGERLRSRGGGAAGDTGGA